MCTIYVAVTDSYSYPSLNLESSKLIFSNYTKFCTITSKHTKQ